MRLDQFLAKQMGWSENTARREILGGKVRKDGNVVTSHLEKVDKFSTLHWKENQLRRGVRRLYLMAHKAAGIVSATSDPEHETILQSIDLPDRDTLHLAGRLDRSSTGLVLLSNDGHWTRAVSGPENKVSKIYLVETTGPIPRGAVQQFRDGFHFLPEDIRTRPAILEILSETRARVALQEGRYHQIKRMFHRLDGLRLRSLHRERIGDLSLPASLRPGEWRHLSKPEVESFRIVAKGHGFR